MSDLGQGAALMLSSFILGWTAFFSFLAAPQAFRDLDQGRANRFVRNAMKSGHPIVAGASFVTGVVGALGGAIAGGAIMGLAGVLYLMAAWTLAPRDDPRPIGGRRVLKTARVVASMLTALIMVVVLVGAILIAIKI
jgi:hypothetical protein